MTKVNFIFAPLAEAVGVVAANIVRRIDYELNGIGEE